MHIEITHSKRVVSWKWLIYEWRFYLQKLQIITSYLALRNNYYDIINKKQSSGGEWWYPEQFSSSKHAAKQLFQGFFVISNLNFSEFLKLFPKHWSGARFQPENMLISLVQTEIMRNDLWNLIRSDPILKVNMKWPIM